MNKKKLIKRLLSGYAQMPGEKKILIAVRLSELVRKVRREGAKATNTSYGVRSN